MHLRVRCNRKPRVFYLFVKWYAHKHAVASLGKNKNVKELIATFVA